MESQLNDHNMTPATRSNEQPTAASLREVLDFAALCHRCLENIELAWRVLEKFQQRLPLDLAELDAAIASGDADQAGKIAHRIKGTAANVSAERLAKVAANITDLARRQEVGEAAGLVGDLREEWKRYLDRASALRSAVDASGADVVPALNGVAVTSETISCASSS